MRMSTPPQWAHVVSTADGGAEVAQRPSQADVGADAGTGSGRSGPFCAGGTADVGADGGTGGTVSSTSPISPSVPAVSSGRGWRHNNDGRVPERRNTDPSIVPPKREAKGSVTPRGHRSVTPDFGAQSPRNETHLEAQPAKKAQERMSAHSPFRGEKASSEEVHTRKAASDSTSAPPPTTTQRRENDKLPTTAARRRARSPVSEASTSTGGESERGPRNEDYDRWSKASESSKDAGLFGGHAELAKIMASFEQPFEAEARERGQRQPQPRHRPGPQKDASPRASPRRASSAPNTVQSTDATPITPRGQATPRGPAQNEKHNTNLEEEELDEPPLYLGRLRNRVFLHGALDF